MIGDIDRPTGPILIALHTIADARWKTAVRQAWTGKVTTTAAALGIGERTLRRWLSETPVLHQWCNPRVGRPRG